MNKTDQDKLAKIFSQIELETPNEKFENNLMTNIKAEQLAIKKKEKWSTIFAITGGAVAMLGTLIIVIFLTGWHIPQINIDLSILNIEVDIWQSFKQITNKALYASISTAFIILLIADELIRKHLREKRGNTDM